MRSCLLRTEAPGHRLRQDVLATDFRFGMNRQAMCTLPLQRISNLAMLGARFMCEPGFKVRNYLGGGFGVWSCVGDQRQSDKVLILLEGYATRVTER